MWWTRHGDLRLVIFGLLGTSGRDKFGLPGPADVGPALVGPGLVEIEDGFQIGRNTERS